VHVCRNAAASYRADNSGVCLWARSTSESVRVPAASHASPPTLTGKYNFLPDRAFQPYIGAGLNVTRIMDVNLQVPTVGRLTLDRTSVGVAAQGGFD